METSDTRGAHHLAGKHIIVAGAGVAGLAFVRALARSWPSDIDPPRVSLYERDDRTIPPERWGYSLGMRSDKASGGLQALRKLGLLDETIQASSAVLNPSCHFQLRDARWRTFFNKTSPRVPPDGLPIDRFRVARSKLRQVLVDGLPKSADAHWRVACESAVRLDDGRIQVPLSDGSVDTCDLLIVSDGANSKIRAALRPHDKLSFAGAVIISAISSFPKHSVPKEVREGSGPVVSGEGTNLITFPIDETSVSWSVTYRAAQPRPEMYGKEAEAAQGELLNEAQSRGHAYADPFSQIINASNPSTLKVFNAMVKEPITHMEISTNPVVYIGDSNHAASPFAGNGANLALMDGVELAEALLSASDIESAVTAFDAIAVPRAKGICKSAGFMIRALHSTGWELWFWMTFLGLLNVVLQGLGR
ncbi:hypothetical protein BAUCODRAFT_77518 [Baudoinia panamericana UAMH 10762]|uniref:FAD-binding domain-containing protein n=1 Tax=Baudoinia panamericana (strain UAMH 10762) TaxID=717646 RepID=M2N1Q2_BAUPA|nr:uncharacterized protein BAUCODRAFT_77518 [Baudoinia panamericana UAMH 10762]EMC92565.1 hypothetical protein BAUCODRAFT_77518 [Baudoinia panamericana UAMH 10762]